MGKAILFRTVLITLSFMGGLCFSEGLLFWAAGLWAMEALVLFAIFPFVEGEPSLRKGRLAADSLPGLFFIITSGLVLISRTGIHRYSFIVMSASVALQFLSVVGLLYVKRPR